MPLFIKIPEIFIGMTASYPTKSSQKRCPNIITTLPDQSFSFRPALQVKMWIPSDKQHLSVYLPSPKLF